MFSSTVSWLIVGGIIPFSSANIDAIASIAPAAPNKWPVIDLVELMFIFFAWSPNTSDIAFNSATSPKGVDVPCVLIWSTSSGFKPAFSKQFFITATTPIPSGCGAVIW